MLEIKVETDGRVHFAGRFDATQVDRALQALEPMAGPIVADLERLDYISSAGLGVFLRTHKRLNRAGHALRLVRLAPRVRNVFELAGFDRIMNLE